MKISKEKRRALFAALIVILGTAVTANWYYNNPESKTASDSSGENTSLADSVNMGDAVYVNSTDIADEYFAAAKISRDESYDNAVATLREIMDSSQADEQSVQTAAMSINTMTERKMAQVNIENTVKAKTGSNCVAIIGEDSVDVIIEEKIITSDIMLQVKEIVIDNTGISAEKISIIGAK